MPLCGRQSSWEHRHRAGASGAAQSGCRSRHRPRPAHESAGDDQRDPGQVRTRSLSELSIKTGGVKTGAPWPGQRERLLMYSTLLLEFNEEIARITFNRPDKRNAINPQLIADLQAAP